MTEDEEEMGRLMWRDTGSAMSAPPIGQVQVTTLEKLDAVLAADDPAAARALLRSVRSTVAARLAAPATAPADRSEMVTVDSAHLAELQRLAAIGRQHPEFLPPDPAAEAALASALSDGRIVEASVPAWRAALGRDLGAWSTLAGLVAVPAAVTLSGPSPAPAGQGPTEADWDTFLDGIGMSTPESRRQVDRLAALSAEDRFHYEFTGVWPDQEG